MRKKYFTVMTVRANQYGLLLIKGNRAVANLTTNAATFPDITNDALALGPEVDLLEVYIGKADGGSELDTANLQEQAQKVYDMMLVNCADIDKVALGVKSVILLSGYDASAEPQVKAIPVAPSIQEIVDGPVPHSAKVKLDGFEKGALHIVEYRKIGDQDWKLGVQTSNTRELIVKGLVKAEEIEVRIADQNSAGKGNYTPPMPFLPR